MCTCANYVPGPTRAFLMRQIFAEYHRDPVGLKLLQSYKKTLFSPDDLTGLPPPIYRLLHLEIYILTSGDDFDLDELRKLKAFRWPMTWLLQIPSLKEIPVPSPKVPPRFVH